jgi:hypothetical protein
MSRSGSVLDRACLIETLTLVLDHVLPACAEIPYRLVGTGAAMLHGVELPVGDLDIILVERSHVDAFGAALSLFTCLQPAAWLPHTRQYYANYKVLAAGKDGVEVGLSTVEVETDSDTFETYGPGLWEKHYSLLPCGSYQVPTVDLELRLITEVYRDRPDRIVPLLAYLREHGCDLDLVRRGLSRGRLPQERVESVLRQLENR